MTGVPLRRKAQVERGRLKGSTKASMETTRFWRLQEAERCSNG